jgi:phosphohistidine phosphatase
LIIRHAKSSWALAGQDDFDRPLNDRGQRDAPEMAQRLLDKKIVIDTFLSSPAKRALTTAVFFAEAYHLKKKDIKTFPELYNAAPNIFYDVVSMTDDSVTTAAIFSHNPGITSFVNALTDSRIDNMPTCGIFGVTIEADHWKDFRSAKKKLWFFDYPKL